MPKKFDIENIEIICNYFPKNIEGRLNAILSSVNTEYKSATLGFFLNDKGKTRNDIRTTAESYIDPTLNRIPHPTVFRRYCRETFIPIGAVAEEKTKYKSKINPIAYYKLTEAGMKYGKPLAQFSLKKAVDYDSSIYNILGPTHSRSESRSPLNTTKILFELYKEDNLRTLDLKDKIGLDMNSISRHLHTLKSRGFINYESISTEHSGWISYKWIKGKDPKDAEKVRGYPTLTKKVADKMQELGVSNQLELAGYIGRYSFSHISTVLLSLEKQGFVENMTKFRGRKKHSEASIKEKGKKFVEEYLEPIYQALEDDFSLINPEIELFDDNLIIQNYISKGFKLYEIVCPAYKKKPKEETKSEILQILSEYGTLRKKEIVDIFGGVSSLYLKELVESGKIEKERKGKAVYYFLAGED